MSAKYCLPVTVELDRGHTGLLLSAAGVVAALPPVLAWCGPAISAVAALFAAGVIAGAWRNRRRAAEFSHLLIARDGQWTLARPPRRSRPVTLVSHLRVGPLLFLRFKTGGGMLRLVLRLDRQKRMAAHRLKVFLGRGPGG